MSRKTKFKESMLKKFAFIGFISVLVLALVTYVIAQREDGHNLIKNDRIEVIAGWSAMHVFPAFVGKSLNELAHAGQEGRICLDTALNQQGWMFHDANKEWVIMQNFGKTIDPRFKPQERFNDDDVWSLLWIKTKNDCTLGCGVIDCMTGRR